MNEEIKKHYRYGGKITHIGVEALPNGNDIDVEIQKIEFKEKAKINGQSQPAWICTFKPNSYFTLPMVLNSTNRKRICRMANNNYPETIKNLKVTLTKEMSNIPGESGKDWALRISSIPPKVSNYEKEINDLIDKMSKCSNLSELADAWQNSEYKSDPKVISIKDKLKENLQ